MSSFVKFCLVGLLNTVTDVTIFTVLHTAGLGLLVANIISTSIALVISFILNRRFTFPTEKVSHGRTALYMVVTLSGLWILAPLTIKALMNLDGHLGYSQPFITMFGHAEVIRTLLPKIGSVAVTLVWNYAWYSRVVFADTKPQTADRHDR